MKILLQYRSSSRVVVLEDGREINKIVEETFGVPHKSYTLKKYDADFEEYVDLLDTATITNQDKLKVENLFVETEGASTSEFSAFLSESSGSVKDAVDYEVVLNLKNKRWPLKIILPVDDFSTCLKIALNDKKDLSWELSKELIGHLANYCYQFSKYPSKLQRQQVCLVLVEMYPHLKNDYGLGVGALEIKLMNKLKRLRQSDISLEVSIIKRASQGGRMPKKVKRQEGKGALNWAPDHFPGEDERTQAVHIEILKQEFLKEEGDQDKNKIANLMALTYSFRRVDINNKISIDEMVQKYPIFFQFDEQIHEFQRLTSVDLKEIFDKNVFSKGPKLFQLFRAKKLTAEQKTFLEGINFFLDNVDIHKRCQAESSYGIMILPFLFHENMHPFFQFVLPDDDTPTLGSVYPVINGGLDFDGTFEIVIEGCVVTRIRGFLSALQLLISYYYTLNISYNKDAVNTLKFIQHILLMINEGNMPPKVITLSKKCYSCNNNFLVATAYLSHIKNAHGHDPNFQYMCGFNECPVLSKNFHAFKKHLFHHKQLCTKPVLYNCATCGFHSYQKRKLISHYKFHSIVECPVRDCNRSYTNFSSFTSHLSRYHPTFLTDVSQMGALERMSESGSSTIFDDPCSTQSNERALLQHKMSSFVLKLQEQFLLPLSTVTGIVHSMKDLQEYQFDLIRRKISELSAENQIIKELSFEMDMNTIDTVLDTVKSRYLRQKLMDTHGLVSPVEYKLGNSKTFQYIPIIDNLKAFCINNDVVKYISIPFKSKSSVLCDVQDGSVFKQNYLFKQFPNIQIILYLDDFVVTNPLRGNQAKHKLTAFYFILANLPPVYRSKVCDMQLAIICKAADLKEFGFGPILKPLLKDLKLLEDIGICIEGIKEKVKGTLVSIVGDNLASHEIGGYTTHFSSAVARICRFCMATSDDRMNKFKEKDFTRRTKLSHEQHMNLINLDDSYKKLYGIKFNSPINDLKFFHTSTMLPPDAMHDLLEGIVPLELSLIISSLIKSKFISLPLLNRRIRKLKFGFNDKPNKPFELNENFSKGIKMTASRTWSLLRFLPLMIGDFVPEDEVVWEFLLILKDIVDIVLSPVINIDYISLLSDLINEHHNLFKKIFKGAKLKPKHHFLVHYPQLILEFGPLVHLWSMRFEAKHLYFKHVAQISKNVKNLPLTLAQRHQQLQCLYNFKGERVLGKNIVVTSAKPIDKNVYSAEIVAILEGYEQFFITQKVLISGIPYKPGMCLVLGFENDEPVFGKIILILCKGSKVLFLCNIYKSFSVFHIRGYQIEKCHELKILSLEAFLDYYPLSVYKHGNNSVVIPKHLIFDHK